MHQPISKVCHVRLNTGEDLIAEVQWSHPKEDTHKDIVLVNPLKIICLPAGKKGYVTLSLMQWVFSKITTEQHFTINNRDVLTMSNPTESLIEYYFETVNYFNNRNVKNDDLEDDEYTEELKKELKAVEESDRSVENTDIKDIVNEILNSLSGNNKGTLH